MTPNVKTVSQAAGDKGVSRVAIYNALKRGVLTRVDLGGLMAVAVDQKYRDYTPAASVKKQAPNSPESISKAHEPTRP